MKNVRLLVKNIPVIGPLLSSLRKRLFPSPLDFRDSYSYWDLRYKHGGNSGSGSFGRLALFKAEILNQFVSEHKIKQIVEWGCGDGNQLALAKYPTYLGYDVSRTAIELCKQKFRNKKNFNFKHVDEYDDLTKYDLSLSLDVIYHLIEDEAFHRYMRQLFNSSKKYVIVYSYNFEKKYESKHEKGREFLPFIEKNFSHWELIQRLENRYPYDINDKDNTSQSDFYFFRKR